MQYKNLGKSPLQVSRLCLGTMMFGDQTDAAEARRIVEHAHAHGVNFIDTADNYLSLIHISAGPAGWRAARRRRR